MTRIVSLAPTPALALSLALLLGLAGCSSLPPTPPAPRQPVVDTLHGQPVADPWRWLEATEQPTVQAWMQAHSQRTRAVLDRIGGRQALLDRMLEVDSGAPAQVQRLTQVASGAWFVLRREAGAAQARLVMRRTLDGADALVLDPAQFGPRQAIDYVIPSPDGRFVAYGLSEAGSEDAALRIREVATGRDLVGPIAGAKFNGPSPYRWTADGREVHFATLRADADRVDKRERFQWARVWRVAAEAGAQPVPVADGLRRVGPVLGPEETMTVLRWGASPWEVAWIEDGVRRDIRALVRRPGSTDWRPLIGHDDGIGQFELRGDRVIALTHRNASRFAVVSTPVAAPDWARAQVLLPEGSGVVTQITSTADALYAVVTEGGRDRLLRLSEAGGAPQEIALPFPGALRLLGNHADRPGLQFQMTGWTEAAQIYRVAPGAARAERTDVQPRGPFDQLPGMATWIELAPSRDGTRVPLSLVQRQGMAGPRPTIIVAYGAYGIRQEPRLRAEWVPWLERGHLMATCHVRGGGEYGQAWYEAGRKQTKPNTWKDLIGCAEHLVKTGRTTPQQLGIMGWSAGGITVGRALTERPELFAAAAPGVGVLDAVRAEVEPNGAANIVEFGTVARADEFRALLAMSAYHHVQPGMRYPAVILQHGANDQRVAVWHSSKMAAALLDSGSDRPVLLNIDFAAGHGPGSSQLQRLSTFADSLAFMLWQMGEPGFAPR